MMSCQRRKSYPLTNLDSLSIRTALCQKSGKQIREWKMLKMLPKLSPMVARSPWTSGPAASATLSEAQTDLCSTLGWRSMRRSTYSTEICANPCPWSIRRRWSTMAWVHTGNMCPISLYSWKTINPHSTKVTPKILNKNRKFLSNDNNNNNDNIIDLFLQRMYLVHQLRILTIPVFVLTAIVPPVACSTSLAVSLGHLWWCPGLTSTRLTHSYSSK